MRKKAVVLPGIVALVLMSAHPVLAQQTTSTPEAPGSTYSSLRPSQKRLIDDWFTRLSAAIQKPIDSTDGYENLPLSARTTFSAVTHALLMTRLTDDSDRNLDESAIELVASIDTVAGQVLGWKADRQFRLFVEMKPGALELLNKSTEFYRAADNTIYHKGYPLSYRTAGGTPSIQVSITRDGSRADIDVDYRSSRFPMALMNGHLTASNSDIRAGKNDASHNAQWSGMQNWWRNLLGMPWAETPQSSTASGTVAAAEPRQKTDKPAEAIYAFLNGWLVEQRPEEALGYFGEQSYACVHLDDGATVDRSVVNFALVQRMREANALIGTVSSLNDLIVGVAAVSERMKMIQQPHHATFVLYDVREDLAEEFKCANSSDSSEGSPKAMKSKAFGKYVGAVFTVKQSESAGRMVATLWQRERGYWKLVSYNFDPEIDRSRVPSVGITPAADAPLEYVQGDKEMIRAASSLLNEWLVRKNVEKALEFVAPESLACAALYRPDNVPAPSTPAESRALLKAGMTSTAEAIGSVRRLDAAIVAPELHHQALKLVKHAESEAFVIAAIPESMGTALDCDRRRPDGEPDFSAAAAAGYGRYFATGFNVSSGITSPATLWIVWSKAEGLWKVQSYALQSP